MYVNMILHGFHEWSEDFVVQSFKYSGAKLWNSLPLGAKVAQSVLKFI
jgi:hypothetical protein